MESDDTATTDEFVLCAPAGWDAYISREFYEIHRHLAAIGWKVMVVGEVEDDCILESTRRARVVLLWECYEMLERHAEWFDALPKEIRRVIFCDDVHYFTAHRQAQRQRAFDWADLILATYPNNLNDWFPGRNGGVRWVPHSAASYFRPIFAPASDRLLLSGARTWPYPFRQFCADKLSADLCEVVDHPGYPGYPGDKNNKTIADRRAFCEIGAERYAALLRRYPAMLVCGSIFNYLVAKVFEGMASGCLIIADRPSLGAQLTALGFREGEHYVGTDVFHAIEDVAAVHRMCREDRAHWSALTANAAHRVASGHTTAIRARQIHAFCADEVRT